MALTNNTRGSAALGIASTAMPWLGAVGALGGVASQLSADTPAGPNVSGGGPVTFGARYFGSGAGSSGTSATETGNGFSGANANPAAPSVSSTWLFAALGAAAAVISVLLLNRKK